MPKDQLKSLEDIPKEDVLPWIQQAVIDYREATLRPAKHYELVFRGAAEEIKRLREKKQELKPDLHALKAQIDQLKAAYFDEDLYTMHWEGCLTSHPHCAIRWLIEQFEADLERS